MRYLKMAKILLKWKLIKSINQTKTHKKQQVSRGQVGESDRRTVSWTLHKSDQELRVSADV